MANTLYYHDQAVVFKQEETVLEALEKNGHTVPYSCRRGLCQSCLMVSDRAVPESAQVGLSELQQSSHHFLACVCLPVSGMHVSQPNRQACLVNVLCVEPSKSTVVLDKTAFPGQYVHIDDEIFYIARPQSSEPLQLLSHQRTWPERFINHALLNAIGPKGESYYKPLEHAEHSLLIVSEDDVLAESILEHALSEGHRSPIHVLLRNDVCRIRDKLNKHTIHLHIHDDLQEGLEQSDLPLTSSVVFIIASLKKASSLERFFFFEGVPSSRVLRITLPAS